MDNPDLNTTPGGAGRTITLSMALGVLLVPLVTLGAFLFSYETGYRSGDGVCDWGQKPGLKECLEREFAGRPVQDIHAFFSDARFAGPSHESDGTSVPQIVFWKTVNDLAGYRVVVFVWVDQDQRVTMIHVA